MLDEDPDMDDQPPSQVTYYHFETGRFLDFKLISLLASERPSTEEILKELIAFTKLGSEGAKEIQQRFMSSSSPYFNIMKEFCYIYSTEFIYKEFNKAFASRSYHRIIKTLAKLLGGLRKQQNRLFRSDRHLYRRIPKDCIKIHDYEKCKKGFWPSFTSTSRNEGIAREYAGKEGFIFVITLSSGNTHPNVILDNNWSKFPRQEEVLLLPYFSLITKEIVQKDGYTYIHVQQNESDGVLSLHDTSRWTQKIEEELLDSVTSEVDKKKSLFHASLQWDHAIKEINRKGIFVPFLKNLLGLFFDSYKSLCEIELEKKVLDILWEDFCKQIELTQNELDKVSKDLAQKYKTLFTDTKSKLEKVIKRIFGRHSR